jgi:hypothetical protein
LVTPGCASSRAASGLIAVDAIHTPFRDFGKASLGDLLPSEKPRKIRGFSFLRGLNSISDYSMRISPKMACNPLHFRSFRAAFFLLQKP